MQKHSVCSLSLFSPPVWATGMILTRLYLIEAPAGVLRGSWVTLGANLNKNLTLWCSARSKENASSVLLTLLAFVS